MKSRGVYAVLNMPFVDMGYNDSMTLREDMIAYRARWRAVEEVQLQALREASIELKWKQLNSIIAMAKGLGIFKKDPGEENVYLQWAKIKEKAEQASP